MAEFDKSELVPVAELLLDTLEAAAKEVAPPAGVVPAVSAELAGSEAADVEADVEAAEAAG